MVPFTPRFVPAILPNLAHHVSMIQLAAVRTNKLLFTVIQNLPSPTEATTSRPLSDKPSSSRGLRSPTPSANTSRQSTLGKDSSRDASSPELFLESTSATPTPLQRARASTADLSLTPRATTSAEIAQPPIANPEPPRPHSPVSFTSQSGQNPPSIQVPEEADLFDYQYTVNELTIQFLSEFEETRVAALKWLIMLHQKAPKKVRSLLSISIFEDPKPTEL